MGRTKRKKTKRYYTDAVGVSMKMMHMACLPADKFEETRKRLGTILAERSSLDKDKRAFAKYCGQKKPPREGPKAFHGKNCAPPMTKAEVEAAGFRCVHAVNPGWAYIIPRRCWHYVRNSKPEARDKQSGQFISAETQREVPLSRKRRRSEEEKKQAEESEKANAEGGVGDSFAWDLRLVAFDSDPVSVRASPVSRASST